MDKLKWLQERQKGIGGSDVGAIMGVNKWKTPFEIYLEKTEEIQEVNEQSESAYWGDQFEEVVAKEFEKRTGKKVRRDRRHFQHPSYPFMVANIDRRVVGENAVLECKTANQFLAKEWESEEIPASYLLQVQHYLEVTGAEKGYIAVLIGGQRFVWKEIPRDDELIRIIVQIEKDFWMEHVEKRIPPALDGSSAAEKYLSEKYKGSNSELSIDLKSEYTEKIDKLLELKNTIKQLENQAKEIENNIKNELGEAEIGYTPQFKVSWKAVSSNRIDSKLLKEKYPNVYKKVCKESMSRRFTIKNLKEEN
ncbi:YqaJ-like viral recombinase domain protein [Clostridium liquoris]|jgi:putative phage-type endonuclease|uniref:YqaJ-like viral recombinase domain protein n=1 Tax=Clostridium liquoris TaxID=1289519 RepID=A0A2T0B1J0_9CLOT|nr:YqaJ viral recombinase family protein [Clostridium liquoris]PRR77661.1 YqaJ-like viral recombinase domain protein [Clostridium liquoris]